MYVSTEAQETAAVLPSVHSSSTDDNTVTTNTQSITTHIFSTVWGVWNTAASVANWIVGRTVSTTTKGIGSDAVTMMANGTQSLNGIGSDAVTTTANGI